MNAEPEIDELPEGLAAALRLHRAGQPDEVIAEALGIPVEGIGVLLQVAEAKLAHLKDLYEADNDSAPEIQ